jgi:hypothetical protein
MAQNLQQLRLELADERRHTAYLLREMDKLQEKIRAGVEKNIDLEEENRDLRDELARCYNDPRNRDGGKRRRQTRRK